MHAHKSYLTPWKWTKLLLWILTTGWLDQILRQSMGRVQHCYSNQNHSGFPCFNYWRKLGNSSYISQTAEVVCLEACKKLNGVLCQTMHSITAGKAWTLQISMATLPRDWNIGMDQKTGPHRFLWKLQKPKKGLVFSRRFNFQNLRGKPKITRFFGLSTGFSFKNQILNGKW
jgi:hypothetical protein